MKNNLLKRKKFWITLLYLSLISVLPLIWYFSLGITNFQTDTIFHYFRLEALSSYFTSPSDFTTFGHQGKIINIMYPPITLLPTLIIKLFTNSPGLHWYFAWTYVMFMLTFSSFIVFWKWSKNYFASIIATSLWTLNLVVIVLIYEHSALANALCYAFYPLVFYGAYELFFNNFKKWYLLAIGLSLVLFTHILSALVLILTLSILFLVSLFFKKWNIKRCKYLLIALVTFVFLSSISFVPILEQYHTYKLASAQINWNISGLNLKNFIMEGLINKSFIGLVNIITIVIVTLNVKNLTNVERSFLGCAYFLILLGLDFGQWKYLRYTPLVQLQFPMYRLLPVALVIFITLVLNLLKRRVKIFKLNLNKNLNQAIIISTMLVFIVINCVFAVIFSTQKWNEVLKTKPNYVSINLEKDKKKLAKMQHRDYANVDYTKYTKPPLVSMRWKFMLNNQVIWPKNRTITPSKYSFQVKTNKFDNTLIIPVSVYKGLNIKVDEQYALPKVSKYGTLLIKLKNKKLHRIVMWYKWTLLARSSQIVSLISWIILMLYIYKRKDI